eukprot:3156398-Ditylum_brightwellii.AAC.1
MVVMKQSTAQRITDTVKFKHHNMQLPTVTPAECIEKAIRELTNAVKANPTEGPANYIEVVQLLRVIVLGEKQQPLVQAARETVPQCNPSQSAEQPALIKAVPASAQVPQQNPYKIATQPVVTKVVPNNALPNRSPALIPYDADKVEPI